MLVLTAETYQYWLIGLWAAACGAYDLWFRRIPNVLTFGAHGGALTMLAATGQGWLGASSSSCFTAWAVGLALTVPAYVLGRLGAGDAKLLAAMGLAGGVEAMLIAYVIAGLLVGGTAIVWTMTYRWAPLFAAHLVRIRINLPAISEPKGMMLPYGLGFAIGFIAALTFLSPIHFDG